MPDPSSPTTADVVVIGGGLMGRSSAWRLAAAGLEVVLVAGEPAAAASNVAAGMLAPVTETTFTEELLLGLNLASMERYPAFAAEVERGQRPAQRSPARDRRSRSPPTPTTPPGWASWPTT